MMNGNNIRPVVFDPKFMIPDDIVDDVICRFLLNIPKEEKFDPIRVCFQVELAHWYFLDYHCGEGCSLRLAQLRNLPYNQFAYIMFQKTPHLKTHLSGVDKHLAAFREYKMRVPTFGAILMNQELTKAVLVQGFRNHWGFPKGKVNEDENPVACAIREVFEETGYDISPLINEKHYIESKVLERNDRLYLIRGVDSTFNFQPQTQFEIKNIKWFNISELPEHKKDTNPAVFKSGVPISNFYSVYSYIKRLKMWVADKLEGRNKIQNFKVRLEHGDIQNANASSQRISNKLQQPGTPGKSLEPFQFPQHFLQSGGGSSVTAAGWQLFPQSNQIEQKPYMMDASTLEELLFSQQDKQQPTIRQEPTNYIDGNLVKASKNPRRRLFSEEIVQPCPSSTAGVIAKPKSSKKKPVTSLLETKTEESPFVRNPLLNAPAWTNFSFDRERVYQAFFNPSQTASVK